MTALALPLPESRRSHLSLVPLPPLPGSACASSQAPAGLLTPVEAAAILRISPKTLANMRSLGRGPLYRKVGGKTLYPRETLVDCCPEIRGFRQSGKPPVTITIRPYPRDKTRSQVDIMIPHPATGDIVRKRLTAPKGMDSIAAKSWGEKQVKDILRGLFVVKGVDAQEEQQKTKNVTPTIGDLWIRYQAENQTEKQSQRLAQEKYWRKIQPLVQDIHCNAWTSKHNKQLLAIYKNLSAGHYNHATSLLRNILRVAIDDEVIQALPSFPRRKITARIPRVAHGQEELAALLAAASALSVKEGEPLELLVLLGIDGGLRPAEVAGLRWQDIDWSQGQMIVQNQRPLAGDSDTACKTGEAGRVTMTRRLRQAIEERRRSGGMQSPYLVTSKHGAPLYTNVVSDRVQKIHVHAGLDPKRGHYLRHCSASRIFAEGDGNLGAAQAHLRHRHASTTQTYLHAVRGTAPGAMAASILDRADAATRLAPGDTGDQIERMSEN